MEVIMDKKQVFHGNEIVKFKDFKFFINMGNMVSEGRGKGDQSEGVVLENLDLFYKFVFPEAPGLASINHMGRENRVIDCFEVFWDVFDVVTGFGNHAIGPAKFGVKLVTMG